MFTLLQINEAHEKVKTGADFPKYIQELKTLGLIRFETWVLDSHTQYFGANGFKIASPPMYAALAINEEVDAKHFEHCLKMHQAGATDYTQFCLDCAKTGIEKWIVDVKQMTCIYFDSKGNAILQEQIPT